MKLSFARAVLGLTVFSLLSLSNLTADVVNVPVQLNINSPGLGMFSDNVIAGAGQEFTFGNGTNIGDNFLLDDESLDITATSFILVIQGLLPTAGGTMPDLDPATTFTLSGLSWGATPGQLIGINLFTDNIVSGVSMANVGFTGTSVTFTVGDMVIGNGAFGGQANPIGTVRLEFVVQHGNVSEPVSLSLLLLGLGGLGLARRRLQK